MHTRLLQLQVLKRFFELCPEQRSTVKLYMVGGCRNNGMWPMPFDLLASFL